MVVAAQFSPAFATEAPEQPLAVANAVVDEVQSIPYTYDPQGRRDPFTPLIQEKTEVKETVSDSRPEKFKGPLEKFELSQFRLIAIVVIKGVPNAMVATPDGKSYRVKVGDYIGLKNGQVKNIETKVVAVDKTGLSYEKNPDRIVVVESGYNKFDGTRVTEKRYIEL
jgi:type IV pilus assembly protein PilP